METYLLVRWPEYQNLMETDWFDECILMNDDDHLGDIGSSAYFVPEYRYLSLLNDQMKTQKIKLSGQRKRKNKRSGLLMTTVDNRIGKTDNMKKFKTSELLILVITAVLIFVSEYYYLVEKDVEKAIFIGLWPPTILALLIYSNLKRKD